MAYICYPIRPDTLTVEFARDEYKKLIDRIESAEGSDSPDGWLRLYNDWNALRMYCFGEMSRLYFRLAGDMTNEDALEAERYGRDELTPVFEEYDSILVNALLASRHRPAFVAHYGEQLFRRLQADVEPLAPVNSDLRIRESELCNGYEKIMATAEVELDGEAMTLSQLGSMASSEDRELRRKVYVAEHEWYLARREELVEIFLELLQIRQKMASNLSYQNFIRLGYLRMARTEYGPDEAARLYENVRRYAVPLKTRLFERQARELDLERLRPYDTSYDPSLTLPRGVVPVDGQFDRAQRLFDALSPRLGEHFTKMREEKLIDLEHRPGKMGGAFCTKFRDEEKVVVLSNSMGDSDDVTILMHEMGHAFQNWESQGIESVDIQDPTADLAEVHSTGMEYLSLRHIDEFLGSEDAEKFRREQWQSGIFALCSISRVDEFQHWIYRHPDATPEDLDRAWREIGESYATGVDWNGFEQYRTVWYNVLPLFCRPFYVIDYAIAELVAMQLALIDNEDHKRAMDIYLNLCRLGGTKGALEAFESAGLRSPFDPDLMRDLMAHAARELGLE